jgi:uncharacterized protein (TIGR02588 family)
VTDPRPQRTGAEWVTFAIALVLVGVVVVLIILEIPGSKRPPSPQVKVGEVVERGEQFVAPVEVTNEGERTAENVQVSATLTIDGEEVATADQSLDFLAAGETQTLEFTFADDPADGELEVEVTGYLVP